MVDCQFLYKLGFLYEDAVNLMLKNAIELNIAEEGGIVMNLTNDLTFPWQVYIIVLYEMHKTSSVIADKIEVFLPPADKFGADERVWRRLWK